MHTVILDDPFEDFSALYEKNRCLSPEPTDEKLEVSYFFNFNNSTWGRFHFCSK